MWGLRVWISQGFMAAISSSKMVSLFPKLMWSTKDSTKSDFVVWGCKSTGHLNLEGICNFLSLLYHQPLSPRWKFLTAFTHLQGSLTLKNKKPLLVPLPPPATTLFPLPLELPVYIHCFHASCLMHSSLASPKGFQILPLQASWKLFLGHKWLRGAKSSPQLMWHN